MEYFMDYFWVKENPIQLTDIDFSEDFDEDYDEDFEEELENQIKVLQEDVKKLTSVLNSKVLVEFYNPKDIIHRALENQKTAILQYFKKRGIYGEDNAIRNFVVSIDLGIHTSSSSNKKNSFVGIYCQYILTQLVNDGEMYTKKIRSGNKSYFVYYLPESVDVDNCSDIDSDIENCSDSDEDSDADIEYSDDFES